MKIKLSSHLGYWHRTDKISYNVTTGKIGAPQDLH